MSVVRFRCPPQCNSYRIVTYFTKGLDPGPDFTEKRWLSHRCLDCGRTGTTTLGCQDELTILGDTRWEELEEQATPPTS